MVRTEFFLSMACVASVLPWEVNGFFSPEQAGGIVCATDAGSGIFSPGQQSSGIFAPDPVGGIVCATSKGAKIFTPAMNKGAKIFAPASPIENYGIFAPTPIEGIIALPAIFSPAPGGIVCKPHQSGILAENEGAGFFLPHSSGEDGATSAGISAPAQPAAKIFASAPAHVCGAQAGGMISATQEGFGIFAPAPGGQGDQIFVPAPVGGIVCATAKGASIFSPAIGEDAGPRLFAEEPSENVEIFAQTPVEGIIAAPAIFSPTPGGFIAKPSASFIFAENDGFFIPDGTTPDDDLVNDDDDDLDDDDDDEPHGSVPGSEDEAELLAMKGLSQKFSMRKPVLEPSMQVGLAAGVPAAISAVAVGLYRRHVALTRANLQLLESGQLE